jgi:hypothetical protein
LKLRKSFLFNYTYHLFQNLERGPNAKRKEVNVPDAIQNFVETNMNIKFMFPWGSEDTVVDVHFWKCLLAMDDCSSG